MTPDPEPEPLPISLVAHHAFCPRRAWLEVHGESTDTAQMAQGVVDHVAVDEPATSRTKRLRAVEVHSDALGIAGRCDSVEFPEEAPITVVEHKANPVRRSSEPTLPQRIQLALQVLCLREQGVSAEAAAVWFSTTRRRVEVPLDDELSEEARRQVHDTRIVVDSPTPPLPLEDDARCRRCSHVSVCLPDEHRQRPASRRIGVADPTGRVLHLASPGSRASLRRGQIEVWVRDQAATTVPLGHVAGLVVHGNADVSSALIREILHRGFPIVWCTWSGRVVGWACSASSPNGNARELQHRLTAQQRQQTASAIVAAKLRNQAALLRRHGCPERVALRDLAHDAASTSGIATLFGIEGRAAALYFRALSAVIKPEWATIERRSGRPAIDGVNAALNVAYSLLLADVLRSILACGLDPAGGVLHSAGRNKPALALDLMEELRAPVADSAVVWAINNGELRERDFRRDIDAVRLTDRGRKALIAAYERRAESEFRHPHYGYDVTWRRSMEVQARMFLAMVLEELAAYRPVEIR
ncbi:MAG: CRISPR-associated endonuclease Cas1 [Solirubrobacteraceae bacterium]